MLIPFDLALWLTTAVTAAIAVRSWALRLRASALASSALVLLALCIELARSHWPGGYAASGDRLRAACATLGAILATTLAFHVRGARASEREPELRESLESIALGWLLVTVLHGTTCLVALDSGFGALLGLLAMLLLCLLAATLRLLRYAKRQRENGAFFRAESGRLLGVLCALTPLLALFVAARDASQLGLGALILVVLVVPFGAPLYPRPPSPGSTPGPERWRRRVLATIALVALLPIGLGLYAHSQRCGGVLRAVDEPAGWQEVAPTASGDSEQLGPFKLHAIHVDYKGYPAPFTDAALGDPGLCFDGTVSLATWFAPSDGTALYRNPAELRLRRVQTTFVVSGLGWDNRERFVTAFRRELSARWAFDPSLSGWFELCALGLWLSALAVLASERRWGAAHAPRWATPALAFRLLLPAALTPMLLEATLAARVTPRPGQELAQDHVAP